MRCARCQAELTPGKGNFYVVRIEAVADPTPPCFSDDDLAFDPRAEIGRLLARIEGLSEQELTDQVYRQQTLHLCTPCYQQWIDDPVGRVR